MEGGNGGFEKRPKQRKSQKNPIFVHHTAVVARFVLNNSK